MPHASHSTGVGRPLGAFHQSLVSRVRHAPHDAWALLGVRTIDPSESESSAKGIVCADGGGVSEELSRRRRRFSSPSFMLWWGLQLDRFEGRGVNVLFPVSVVTNDFIDGARTDFVTDSA